MVLQLSTRTPVEYETNLLHLVRNHQRKNPGKIVLVDCQSTLTKYLLSNASLKPFFARVDVVRVEEAGEFLHLLRSLSFRNTLAGAIFLIVSPFEHLISDQSVWKQKKFLYTLEDALEKLEAQLGIHAVVAEG